MNLEDSLNLLKEKSDELKHLLDVASSAINKTDAALSDSAFKNEFKWNIPESPYFLIWAMHTGSDKWKIHLYAQSEINRPFIECPSKLRLKYYQYLPQFISALVESQK